MNGRCQRLDFSEPALYKIRLKICKKSKQVEFSLNFNLDEADPFQFVYFVEFVRQAKKENRLILRLADGKVLQEGPFPVEFEAPTEDWMRILRALAEIQHKTSIRLPIPKSVSSDDLNKIDRLYQITTKGEIDAQVNSLTVNFS